MKKTIWIAILFLLFQSCSSHKYANPHIIITTKLGDIEIELFTKQAPKTCAAFLSYIKEGLYKDASFYRVLNSSNQASDAPKAKLIQGGIWQTQPDKLATLKGIPHESTKQTGILHKNGTISLAREAPGTANSEFFICIGDQPGYDYGGANNADGQGYAAFGRVVRGMKVVLRIYHMPENNQSFTPPIPIYGMQQL